MRHRLLTASLLALATSASAQPHTLVALSHSDHTAYELDPATGKILHQFKAADEPHEGLASPDGRRFYLAVPNGPHVVVLDAGTFKELARIESPFFKSSRANGSASPHGSALTTDGSKLYVGLENADVPGIVVIDTKTNRVIKKIDVVLAGGHFLAIQPGTDKLYYPMRNDNRVVVIDTKTDAITKLVTVPGGPVGVGFAPNGDVWIHCDGDGTVHVIDSKRDSVVAVLKDLGKGAGRMAVSPDGKWAASMIATSCVVPCVDAAHLPSRYTAIRPAPSPRFLRTATTESRLLSITCTVPSPSQWIQTSPFGAKPTPTGPPGTVMIFVIASVLVSITTTRLSFRIG